MLCSWRFCDVNKVCSSVRQTGSHVSVLCLSSCVNLTLKKVVEKNVKDIEDPQTLFNELMEIGKKYPHTANIDKFLIHPSFPVDIRHNAKIGREKLAAWAADNLKGRN